MRAEAGMVRVQSVHTRCDQIQATQPYVGIGWRLGRGLWSSSSDPIGVCQCHGFFASMRQQSLHVNARWRGPLAEEEFSPHNVRL